MVAQPDGTAVMAARAAWTEESVLTDPTYAHDPRVQLLRNPCPRCHAQRGQYCLTRGNGVRTLHRARASVPASPACTCDGHPAFGLKSAVCKCGCHTGQEYVPSRGWLDAVEAVEDRRAYLDLDTAISRAYDHERGL